MAERLAFLSKAYSAYYHRGMPPVDKELTQVGSGTPCGEYLRRFWQPVVVSSDLGDVPKRLKILGSRATGFAAVITAGSSAATARSSKRRASRPTAP